MNGPFSAVIGHGHLIVGRPLIRTNQQHPQRRMASDPSRMAPVSLYHYPDE